MSNETTLTALQQLRSDLITALARMESEITALQYAILDQSQPMTSQRLGALQEMVKEDAPLQKELRGALERTIHRIRGA